MNMSYLSKDTKQQPEDNMWILHPEEDTLLITKDCLLTAGCPSADLCQQVMSHHSAGEDHPVLVLGGPDCQGRKWIGGSIFSKYDCASFDKGACEVVKR